MSQIGRSGGGSLQAEVAAIAHKAGMASDGSLMLTEWGRWKTMEREEDLERDAGNHAVLFAEELRCCGACPMRAACLLWKHVVSAGASVKARIIHCYQPSDRNVVLGSDVQLLTMSLRTVSSLVEDVVASPHNVF